ncbi:hypothetical protein ACFL4G_03260 [Thermodesulfobacteriota bacterium]
MPVGIAAVIIRGDPTPDMKMTLQTSTATPAHGDFIKITAEIENPSYVASGVHLSLRSMPDGVSLWRVETIREDGIVMDFTKDFEEFGLTLGNIRESDTRSVLLTFLAKTTGRKVFRFWAWSENGGTHKKKITVKVH